MDQQTQPAGACARPRTARRVPVLAGTSRIIGGALRYSGMLLRGLNMQNNEIMIYVEINEEGVYEAFDEGQSFLVLAKTQHELLANVHDMLASLFGSQAPTPKFILH